MLSYTQWMQGPKTCELAICKQLNKLPACVKQDWMKLFKYFGGRRFPQKDEETAS